MNSIGKQTIVVINAGHEAPLEVLQLLLDKKPKQFGLTVQAMEEGQPELSVMRTNDIPSLENLVEMNANTKDFNVHMCFGFIEGDVDQKNIQPFICVDGNDTPYMSMVVEGVFSKFNEPIDSTEELNLFDNFIYPEIETALDLSEGDIEKVKSHLSSERFNKSFLSHTDHRGVLSILHLEGDPVLNFKNELGETYPWGYLSQRHGYGDTKQEPEIKKVEVKKAGWWKKSGAVAPASEAKQETKVEAKAPAKPSVPAVEAKKDKEPVKAARPPAFLHSNSDMKAWYTAVAGVIPANWKKRVPVTVKHEVPEWSDLKDFQAWAVSEKLKTGTATMVSNTGDIKAPEAPASGLLPKKEMESALDYIAKYLDGQSTDIPDPKMIQSTEAKIPTLSETLAFDAEGYLNWPKEKMFKFFAEHPTAGALAFVEVRDMLRPFVKVKAKAKVEKTEEETKVVTTTKTEGGTTHQSSVVVPTGEKKGKWWGKKTA